MAPTFAMDDSPNCVLGDAETFANFAKLHPIGAQFANEANVIFCKFCDGVRFALTACIAVSAFGRHILVIFGTSAEKKMMRVYARTVVAFVAHIQPLWNRAIVDFP